MPEKLVTVGTGSEHSFVGPVGFGNQEINLCKFQDLPAKRQNVYRPENSCWIQSIPPRITRRGVPPSTGIR